MQAARIVNPPFQRTVAMAMAKSKGPVRAVSAVAAKIVSSRRWRKKGCGARGLSLDHLTMQA